MEKNWPKYKWEEISKHRRRRDCWLLIDGKVYDVSNFEHPGGWATLVRASRNDATDPFFDIEGHKSDRTKQQMEKLQIGVLDEEDFEDEELNKERAVKLEMDEPTIETNKAIDLNQLKIPLALILLIFFIIYIVVSR